MRPYHLLNTHASLRILNTKAYKSLVRRKFSVRFLFRIVLEHHTKFNFLHFSASQMFSRYIYSCESPLKSEFQKKLRLTSIPNAL